MLSPNPESETPEDVPLGETLVSGKDSSVMSFSCNLASRTCTDFKVVSQKI
jgi:hypothetical protein